MRLKERLVRVKKRKKETGVNVRLVRVKREKGDEGMNEIGELISSGEREDE